jgi:hypothetical protein
MADIRQLNPLSEISGVALPDGKTSFYVTESAGPYRGTSSYFSGVAGTVTLASGARIISISAIAAAVVSGTITIFGGMAITVPPSTAFSDVYAGFVGPGDIVFTGTATYYVVVNQ